MFTIIHGVLIESLMKYAWRWLDLKEDQSRRVLPAQSPRLNLLPKCTGLALSGMKEAVQNYIIATIIIYPQSTFQGLKAVEEEYEFIPEGLEDQGWCMTDTYNN